MGILRRIAITAAVIMLWLAVAMYVLGRWDIETNVQSVLAAMSIVVLVFALAVFVLSMIADLLQQWWEWVTGRKP